VTNLKGQVLKITFLLKMTQDRESEMLGPLIQQCKVKQFYYPSLLSTSCVYLALTKKKTKGQ